MDRPSPDFRTGIIEGFYGKPWNARQRHQALVWCQQLNFNTYVYAPKDDLKHRQLWRELYSETELAELGALVRDCTRHQVDFVYAISPGLDIAYDSQDDLGALSTKLGQIAELGARHFGILFDDLPAAPIQSDDSPARLAQNQAVFVNALRSRLANSPATLMFCPTPYCARMSRRAPGYLDTLGTELDPAIDVFWTGAEIVPETITDSEIRDLARRLHRKPLIWDNLFANDYDHRRVFLGPYAGRHPTLRHETRGILINPNGPFEVNFVPLRCFAEFLESGSSWDAEGAFRRALGEWLPAFETAIESAAMSSEELALFADTHYLPHHYGPRARQFSDDYRRLIRDGAAAPFDVLERFRSTCARYLSFCTKIVAIKNRDLLHAVYPLIWELREEIGLCQSYIEWRRNPASNPDESFTSDEYLPKVFRGGFVADLARLLPMNATGGFKPVDDGSARP